MSNRDLNFFFDVTLFFWAKLIHLQQLFVPRKCLMSYHQILWIYGKFVFFLSLEKEKHSFLHVQIDDLQQL